MPLKFLTEPNAIPSPIFLYLSHVRFRIWCASRWLSELGTHEKQPAANS